jgi:hypothetical protein
MAKQTPKQLREKIAARKAERKAENIKKYAKMRSVAAKAPEKLEKHLIRLADKYASMAEGIENLRENLGLVRAAKRAPLEVRKAAAEVYGKKFKKIAVENPEKLAEALAEAYEGLNEIAQDIEFAAEQMGVDLADVTERLGTPPQPSEEQEVAEDIVGEAKEEGEPAEVELFEKAEGTEPEEEAVEEKEAAGGGSDAWVTDRNESGQPKTPEKVDVPRVAGAGGGADAWVTDRDESGSPEAPEQVNIPQADVKAAGLQEVSGGTPTPSSAEEFVSKIPQSQGKAAGMSKQDFILIADALRNFAMANDQRENLARHLSRYLRSSNPLFKEDRFVDYVMGRGGPSGGAKFRGTAPNVPGLTV